MTLTIYMEGDIRSQFLFVSLGFLPSPMSFLRIFWAASRPSYWRNRGRSDNHDDSIALLPPTLHSDGENSSWTENEARLPLRHPRHRRWRRPTLTVILVILGSLALVLIVITVRRMPIFTAPTTMAALTAARLSVDALYHRQSRSLAQASARYTLRNGRSPPPNYEKWYNFAREKKCLIDEYDQIYRDFEPFYQLATENPAHFREMVERASEKVRSAEVAVVEINNSEVQIVAESGTAYTYYWAITLGRFSQSLPNMTLLLNGRDEPRVAFNYRVLGAKDHAFDFEDTTPFEISPRPTAEFFKKQSGCIIANDATGFMSSVNDDSAFLISTAKPGFTTDLYPVLSMAKVSPCFSDILFPSEYYYDQSWWSPKFSYPDNVAWENKKSQIYWRGMSNGGMILGDNYHHFARFKLADMARKHPDLMDVAITRFAETLCEEGCDRDAVVAEYNITGDSQPREDLYRYKYAIDVDGTTFSGRYLGLLRSGSLVFKATIFEEYFDDWLVPYEHFVPVLPDLSDLVQKIKWANSHPEEARLIQQKGLEVARRVLTDNQNDCYFFAVLLEWARLYGMAKSQDKTMPSRSNW
ncbi:glycosyl transferase family 90-domain-containing protein [Mycena sp. CBHHK59/15]|nr:glycosyl transferase family 90-domain-containing protein [Mycena sp. CBHHK59/15]